MKKILLATTLLAGTSSFAAAEVTLSGSARMGLINDFAAPGDTDQTDFTSRARVTFTMSGETEGGLSFGASFRADNAADANNGTAGSVFISGAFGKLSMGDVDGAAQAAVGHIDGVGLTGLGDKNESTYVGSGGFSDALLVIDVATGDPLPLTGAQSALYEFTIGSLSVYASVTSPTYGFEIFSGPFADPGDYQGDSYAVGAAYTIDAYKVSLGYEKLDANRVSAGGGNNLEIDHLILGGDATFGDVVVKGRYGTADVSFENAAVADLVQVGLSATYSMDALSVTGFTQKKSLDEASGANVLETTAIGLGASYDLGGGASVKGGVAKLSEQVGGGAKTSDTAFDIGVSFTF